MIERKQFFGGMDAESVPDSVAPEDYLVAKNCRVLRDNSGNAQAMKPVNGTTLRVNHEDALAKYTIASITDEEKGRVYWFMYQEASPQNHTIWMWDRKTNTGYRALRSANIEGGLNLSRNFPANGIALIGDFLYWTDNNNEPRQINIERALRTENPAYISQDGTTPEAYTVPIKQTDITVYRRMPTLPPIVEKLISSAEDDITDQPVNLLNGNSFQFAYRYRDKSGQYSVLSPYSLLIEHLPSGDFSDTVRVDLSSSEYLDEETEAVEFLVRKGNTASWNIVKTFERDNDDAAMNAHNTGTDLGFYFFNDRIGIPVSDSEADVLFHDVPLKSKGLEVAQNRLFLANNERGYDFAGDIGLTAIVADPLEIGLFGTWLKVTIDCPAGTTEWVVVLVEDYNIPGYSFINQFYYDPTYTPAAFDAGTLPSTIPLALGNGIGPGPGEILSPCHGTSPYTISYTSYSGNPLVEITGLVPVTIYETNFVLKQSSTYEVGVVFFDKAGRNAGVNHQTVTVNNPKDYFGTSWSQGIAWTLPGGAQLDIPEWADSYAIVRSKNRTYDNFVTWVSDSVRYGDPDAEGVYTFSGTIYGNEQAIGIDISDLIGEGIGYTFTEGDFIKLLNYTDEYVLKIIGTQGNYIIASAENLGDLTGDWMYEVYRLPIDSDAFFEVGAHYLIDNPGTVNRSYSTISGVLRGDVFLVTGTFNSLPVSIERMNRDNDYWQIWDTDIGRPNVVFFSEQRRYNTEVAWGGVFFPGTQANDLNAFLSGDIRTIDSAIGSIQKLVFTSRTQEYGSVMLAIGTTDVASLYIGRVELYNAEEGANVVSSGDVIGSVNVLRGGYGTISPESVVENDGNVYWFSAIKGAFARYNRDGVNNISHTSILQSKFYKFGPVARWLGEKIVNATDGVDLYLLPGGYDEYNDEYVVALPTENRSLFPVAYEVMEEMDEEVTVTSAGGFSYLADLEAGEVYKFEITIPSGFVTVQLTDFYFGFPATFSGSGAGTYEFQFVASKTGSNNFSITVASGSEIKLYKQRLNPYTVLDNMPKTLRYNESSNRWSLVESGVPEWFGRIADVLISYKNAVLYTHDDTVNKARFYGVDYPSSVSFVSNMNMNVQKRFQGVSLETDTAPDYVHIETEIPNRQSSDIVKSEFDIAEGIPYASFRKDGLSPNVSGTRFEKQARGDDMVGRYAKILIEYAKNSTFVTRVVNIISRISAGHKT